MNNYSFVEKKSNRINIFKVTIVADSNDADYITEYQYMNKSQFENSIDELINLRDNFQGNHELPNYENVLDLPIPCND